MFFANGLGRFANSRGSQPGAGPCGCPFANWILRIVSYSNALAVNTRFSCLCTLDPDYSFVPRWQPPFVTALAAEDRCHLNGLAMAPGERGVFAPQYVTALGETDT